MFGYCFDGIDCGNVDDGVCCLLVLYCFCCWIWDYVQVGYCVECMCFDFELDMVVVFGVLECGYGGVGILFDYVGVGSRDKVSW